MVFGKLQVYTGNGKGKTTSALGLAIRALGYNKKVYFIQFLKNKKTGEEIFFKNNNIKNIIFKKYGSEKFILDKNIKKKDIDEANKAIKYIKEIIAVKKIDLLILDELNLIIYYKLIDLKEILKIIKICKQKKIEIIITGRKLNPIIKKEADLITEMKEIKHYYPKQKERKGIEF
jgi:cob(I)alamin adenosyltransferase